MGSERCIIDSVATEDDSENDVMDVDSKVVKSLSATDKITEENFEEFDIKSVIDSTACAMADEKTKENTSILEAEFNKKMEEMKRRGLLCFLLLGYWAIFLRKNMVLVTIRHLLIMRCRDTILQ